jgi:hypothetical protein
VSVTPLDYVRVAARPPRCPRLSRPQRVVVALVPFVLAVGAFFGNQEVRTDIDAVTGSTKSRTLYPFGITFGPQDEAPSAVERRLRAIGAAWTPQWQPLGIKSYSMFGLQLSRGCYRAPPVYSFQSADDSLLATVPDAEVVAFVRDMESRASTQQEATVEAMIDRICGCRVCPMSAAAGTRGPSAPE